MAFAPPPFMLKETSPASFACKFREKIEPNWESLTNHGSKKEDEDEDENENEDEEEDKDEEEDRKASRAESGEKKGGEAKAGKSQRYGQ